MSNQWCGRFGYGHANCCAGLRDNSGGWRRVGDSCRSSSRSEFQDRAATIDGGSRIDLSDGGINVTWSQAAKAGVGARTKPAGNRGCRFEGCLLRQSSHIIGAGKTLDRTGLRDHFIGGSQT